MIIEPFAGSARYSLKYWNNVVILVEKYDLIVKLWKWLQQAQKEDILKLPKMQKGDCVDDYNFDCQEAKWLMGFLINQGSAMPKKTVSKTGNFGVSEREILRISNDVEKIRKWDIFCADYRQIPNCEATWFIDPPYQFGGQYYRLGNKNINYKELAEWCMSRKGQVIVCENTKATWMDFKPLKEMQGSIHRTTEAIWYKNN